VIKGFVIDVNVVNVLNLARGKVMDGERVQCPLGQRGRAQVHFIPTHRQTEDTKLLIALYFKADYGPTDRQSSNGNHPSTMGLITSGHPQ
jgi:hypothetical protein